MTIQQRIFYIMKEKGISQAELSRRTGISTSTICDWKKKNNTPSSDKLSVIADALETTVHDLTHYIEYYADCSEDSDVTGFVEVPCISPNTSRTAKPYVPHSNCKPMKNNAEPEDFFNNPAVSKAYKGLTEREKLSVQMFILDTAAASEKSNATIKILNEGSNSDI